MASTRWRTSLALVFVLIAFWSISAFVLEGPEASSQTAELSVATGTELRLSSRATIFLGFTLKTTSLKVTSVSIEIGGVNLTIMPSNGTLTATLLAWNPTTTEGLVLALNASHSVPAAQVTFSILPLRGSTHYLWQIDGVTKQDVISDGGGKVTVSWSSWSSHALVLAVGNPFCLECPIPFFPFIPYSVLIVLILIALIGIAVALAGRRGRREEGPPPTNPDQEEPPTYPPRGH